MWYNIQIIKVRHGENKKVKTRISAKRSIQLTIVLLTVFTILLIWPWKLITRWQTEGSLDADSRTIVQTNEPIMQKIEPVTYGLSNLSFYIYNEDIKKDDCLLFKLYDANFVLLDERQIRLEKFSLPGVCKIRINSELVPGGTYYFSVEKCMYEFATEITETELLYSMPDDIHLDVQYRYKIGFTRPQYAACALGVLMAGGILILLTEILMRKNRTKTRWDFGIRLAAAVLVTGAALWGAWNVFPGKRFSPDFVDIVFYETGIFLFLAYALYGLLRKREAGKERLSPQEILKGFPRVLQSFAFAGGMLGCVRYANALSTYDQKTASGLVLSCFAAAIICGYSKKEILNWYNVMYLVPAVPLAVLYCFGQRDNLEAWDIARGTAVYSVLWGIVLLNTVRLLVMGKREKISVVYAVALLLLAVEMVRSRNGQTWPVEIAVYWGMFAIRVIHNGRVQDYLHSFSNGLFLHFIGISLYALWYRPFHYFYYIRYPGVFHTVTMAAVYLVLVVVLAQIRFLECYRKTGSLKRCWKELGLLGTAMAFLILTISRTGLLAAALLCPFLLIITTIAEFRDGWLGFWKRTGIFMITGISFFCVVFTGCRIVPAVVGHPFTYEIEWFVGSIKEGEEWDSRWFATVPRLFGVTEERVLVSSDDSTEGQQMSTPQVVESRPADGSQDYSNGRLDIFKAYLKALNWKGHETISLQPEGQTQLIVHAHNSFIQTAYDFGLGCGIYFLVFCLFAGIRSIGYYIGHREDEDGLVPVTILGMFGICGMVERVFFPYYASGFAFLIILALLIPDWKRQDKRNYKKNN